MGSSQKSPDLPRDLGGSNLEHGTSRVLSWGRHHLPYWFQLGSSSPCCSNRKDPQERALSRWSTGKNESEMWALSAAGKSIFFCRMKKTQYMEKYYYFMNSHCHSHLKLLMRLKSISFICSVKWILHLDSPRLPVGWRRFVRRTKWCLLWRLIISWRIMCFSPTVEDII